MVEGLATVCTGCTSTLCASCLDLALVGITTIKGTTMLTSPDEIR